jgi:P-type Ca2+ transporter type 2C
MGKRGTDVAREAASLVLLDADFSSIVGAVRLGRRIYDNIRHAMTYILAIHVPIAGISLLPLLFGWPLVLLPVQIVFLELIIDPACSVVFEAEPEHPQVMKRPPRDPKAPLFGRRTLLLGLSQGVCAFMIALTVLLVVLHLGLNDQEVRTLTFITLVLENLGLILANRSYSRLLQVKSHAHNATLRWIVGGALVLLGGVLIIPGLRDLFGFKLEQPLDLLICLIAGVVGVLSFTLLKRLVEWYVREGKRTLLPG